jgi:purine-binding chemotaxis protein CheW
MATTHFCTLSVAGILYGIEVARVQEVLRAQRLTRVPLAHGVVAGLMNLRGQIVTAIDLRRRLALPERPAGKAPTHVVVQAGGAVVSLLVDDVGDVIPISSEAFEPVPETVRRPARDLLRGAYKLKDRLLLWLDAEEVVNLESKVREGDSEPVRC